MLAEPDAECPAPDRRRRTVAGLGFSALFALVMLLGMPAALAREAPEEGGPSPPGAAGTGTGAAAKAAEAGAGAALSDRSVQQAQDQATALLDPAPAPASAPALAPSKEPERQSGGVLPWLLPSGSEPGPAAGSASAAEPEEEDEPENKENGDAVAGVQPPPPTPLPTRPAPPLLKPPSKEDPGGLPFFRILPALFQVYDKPAIEVTGWRDTADGGLEQVTEHVGGDAPTINMTDPNGKALVIRPETGIKARVLRPDISRFGADWVFDHWEIDRRVGGTPTIASGRELRLPPSSRAHDVYARYRVTSKPGTMVEVRIGPPNGNGPPVPVRVQVPPSADGTRAAEVHDVVSAPGPSLRLPYATTVTLTAPDSWIDYDTEYLFDGWVAFDPANTFSSPAGLGTTTTWTVVPGARVFPLYSHRDREPTLAEMLVHSDFPRLVEWGRTTIVPVFWH
jgi:hypothetical protein